MDEQAAGSLALSTTLVVTIGLLSVAYLPRSGIGTVWAVAVVGLAMGVMIVAVVEGSRR